MNVKTITIKPCTCKGYTFPKTKTVKHALSGGYIPPSPGRFFIDSEGIQCGKCLGWYKYKGEFIEVAKEVKT